MARTIRLHLPAYLAPPRPQGRIARAFARLHNKLFHVLEYVDWPYAVPPEVFGYCRRNCGWSLQAPADALRSNPGLNIP